MRRPMLILALTALALTSLVSAADPPDRINYQGVLRNSADEPLDGSFPMTFRFFDDPTAGNEVLVDTYGAVTVSNGLFNVALGGGSVTDGSGPGSFTTLADVFAARADLYLEVEVNGETLAPRTPVVAAAYALNARRVRGVEVVSVGPIDLYVDAIAGDDDNDGFSPGSPKRTINAAIDQIPAILGGDVTVHIANGTYQEEIVFFPRFRTGVYFIRLVGNETSPDLVILDGTAVPPVSRGGVESLDLAVEVSGITITGFPDAAISASHGGTLQVHHCRLIDNGRFGIDVNNGGFLEVSDCVISGNQESGMRTVEGGAIDIGANVEIANNPNAGLTALENSDISIESPCSLVDNDMFAGDHSSIKGYSACALTNSSCSTLDPSGRCVP